MVPIEPVAVAEPPTRALTDTPAVAVTRLTPSTPTAEP